VYAGNIAPFRQSDTISVDINQKMLQMFLDFRDKGTISESIIHQFLSDTELRQTANWRQVWEDYLRALGQGEAPLKDKAFIERVQEEAETTIMDIRTPLQKEELPMVDKHEKKSDAEPAVQPFSNAEASAAKTVEDRVSEIKALRYHIQIAASVAPLDESYLDILYSGGLNVHNFEEDVWTKYYVGEFNSFASAREYLQNNIDVDGAFIIAYCFGRQVPAYKARQFENVMAHSAFSTFHNNSGEEYRVQIAASRYPLGYYEVKSIYTGDKTVGVIFEEGWFKYSLPGASTLSDSWEIAGNASVDGAFVVMYRKGEKIPLR